MIFLQRTTLSFLLLFCLISTAQAVDPLAAFSASNLAICAGGSTTFTNNSTGTITSYSWNFGSGASPATANSIGPHNVTYSNTGSKTVTLTVTGTNGNSTTTKTNYISVGLQRIKLMSYNVLNYYSDAADSSQRNPYFRTVIEAADPDILVVQEMTSLTGMNVFLSNILNANSNSYSKGTFINGPDSDNGIFYKTSKFSFISNTPIETDLRDINEFKIKNTLTGDTLRIYSVHLKASSGGSNEDQRELEVDSLRKFTNALPANSNFLVCGDFNIYGSGEQAYIKLLANNPIDDGNFIDPVSMTGSWGGSANAIKHTQCTRDTALGNGGANGGMNDRFDMILYSTAISAAGGISYVTGSTTPYGNDGLHWQKSIYLSPNNAVGTTIAYALYQASDHLPVSIDLDFQLYNCQSLDLGATALVSPASSVCPSVNKTMQVRIKNLGLNTIDFNTNHADVNLQVTKPSSAIVPFSKTVLTGTLASGATLDVTFDNSLDMSAPGNYTFSATTVYSPDANSSNNSMTPATVSVSQVVSTVVNPPGPISICSGSTATLNAANGSDYFWSNGATTQSIVVSSAGNYSVSMTDVNGCLASSSPVSVSVSTFLVQNTILTENMGSVGGTTTIASHESSNGFQNTGLTMSGTGDVRNTNTSTGYATASAGANVFLTNAVGKNFIVSGINTSSSPNVQLSFGLFKSTTASNGSDFLVQYSTNGISFSPLTFTLLPTGSGTAIWHYVTINETLPSSPSLSLQFIQNGTVSQYRVDDIKISSSNSTPIITPQGPTTFCTPGSVTLNASTAVSYLWSNGATVQNIVVNSSGNYSVTETSSNGCSASSSVVSVSANICTSVLNVKVFLEGYYNGNGSMKEVTGNIQNQVCDSITIQLANSQYPFSIIYQEASLLHINGNVQISFPPALIGNSYYVVVKHRNSLQTWSASPVALSSSSVSYDFTNSAMKAYGSNLKLLDDGNFAVYSGDANQDEAITMTDFSLIDSDLHFFVTGYLSNDLNGDYVIESTDLSIVENNLFRLMMRPH